jgi:hypothetical protein
MTAKYISLACLWMMSLQQLNAWGFRGHTVADLAAVESIGGEGPRF